MIYDNWGDIVLGEAVDYQGDPPRIWVPGKEFPGTAFTRSLGDKLAEIVGCVADPEMVSYELTSNDHILVLASDGVFEFLTNQEVINLVAQYSNPHEACEALVKKSYAQWKQHESRVDDFACLQRERIT